VDLKKQKDSSCNWVAIAIALAGVLGSASGARAQIAAQFDLNQFRPSELATDGFALSHADGQGHLRFGVQIYLDFARNPLELRVTGGPIPDQTFALVRSQLTGHLLWSLGLWDRLVIFMDLPYHFILRADLTDSQRGFLDSINQGQLIPRGRGLGDLYVGARGVLYGTRANIFQLAAQATLTANTASAARSDQNYLGEPNKSPNIGGWFELLGTFNGGNYVRVPLNIGYKTGFTRDVPSLGIGSQLTFGAGVQVLLGQDRFMLTVESFGRTTAQSGTGFGGRQETPVELLGGFKYFHQKGFATGIAGTGGVTSGYGNPDWRLIGMLAYTMPEKERPAEPVDTDGDGIVDARDDCPKEPEDFDGFRDEDGCPDFDNDADGILDVDDACPDEPGPVENQGCPTAEVVVVEVAELEILDKIYFDFDSARLQGRSNSVLDSVAEVLNAHPELAPIQVEGHTDSRGRAEYNLRLSQKRAEAVVRYLVNRGGVDASRFLAEGFGESRPLVLDATTDEEMAQNRRVEFHFSDVEPESSGDPSGD
jgi:outer membrane protein OmpA-like peptidoglycan-associated protein